VFHDAVFASVISMNFTHVLPLSGRELDIRDAQARQ